MNPRFQVGDVVRVRPDFATDAFGRRLGALTRWRVTAVRLDGDRQYLAIATITGAPLSRFVHDPDLPGWSARRFELIASAPAQPTPTEGPTTVNPTTSPTFKPGDRVKRVNDSTTGGLVRDAIQVGEEATVERVFENAVGHRRLRLRGSYYVSPASDFELVDTRPSYEKLGIAPGDLVKATKGESVRQDRAFEGSSGRLFLNGSALENLERRGYSFEIVEKALPPLPTEDGFYVEADPAAPSFRAFTANVYELDGGDWHVRPWEPAMRTTSIDAPEHLRGKLVRLVAAEVAA